jgi:transposase
MEKYTLKERVEIVQIFYENGRSVTGAPRALRSVFPRNHVPSENTIRNLIKKFVETGSVVDVPSTGRPTTVRSSENIGKVRASVEEAPGTSISRRSQQLGIRPTSLRRILTEDLQLRPYKVQFIQKLEYRDHSERAAFAEWIQSCLANDTQFCEKIIFSDEAHFHLGGYVNKQNCRIWGSENPQVTCEQAQ